MARQVSVAENIERVPMMGLSLYNSCTAHREVRGHDKENNALRDLADQLWNFTEACSSLRVTSLALDIMQITIQLFALIIIKYCNILT